MIVRDKIEAIKEARGIVASCRNGRIAWPLRLRVNNLLDCALAACDETCEYTRDGRDYLPECGRLDNLRLITDEGSLWTHTGAYYEAAFCRFCGRKIKDPAAPAAENGDTK